MAETMRAMLLDAPGQPLRLVQLPVPSPGPGQVLIRVEACGVCRTDLHLLDGELPDPVLPMIPGHEIVGRIAAVGSRVEALHEGARVGVPWLGWTCGDCEFCRSGRENLCNSARFTGYHIPGGFAEYTVADARFCFSLPEKGEAVALAPLLCAGLIGYRALSMTTGHGPVGLYGFGAAAHIAAQILRYQGRGFYAFTRPGDKESQDFALSLGADWAGPSDVAPPHPMESAVLFAPAGALLPEALSRVQKGGTVVCGGIHMSDIPSFPYSILWGERTIRSVANLTRRDGDEFLALAARVPVRCEVSAYTLEQANQALEHLRHGALQGAAVLKL